jgi:hypothetical protein
MATTESAAAAARRLAADRETAEAQGLTDRVQAIDKQLAALGVKPSKRPAKAVDGPPQDRHSRERETTDVTPVRRGPGRPRKSESD